MTVHLIKLAAGSQSIATLAAWQRHVMAERRASGLPAQPVHITRMTPKRVDELLDGGSMYWVIKGMICVRQTITDLEGVIGADGLARCCIVLEPKLVETEPTPRKAFQGWRYLKGEDAPADLSSLGGGAGLPEPLRRELMNIGAW